MKDYKCITQSARVMIQLVLMAPSEKGHGSLFLGHVLPRNSQYYPTSVYFQHHLPLWT